MSSWDNNIYYNPEKWGLVQVASIDWSDGNWQFDLTVVWQHTDGTFYTADSAGCSCPSPFEEYDELSDLTVLDLKSLRTKCLDFLNRAHKWGGEPDEFDVTRFYDTVQRAVRDYERSKR